MRIAICDDDPEELQRIKKTAEQFAAQKQPEQEITVFAFLSGEDLLCSMKKQGGVDLVILDILMPGMNGIELAEEIRERGDNCRIIFITSSPEFAVDSYKVHAFYYLLKPWSETELTTLIGRALLDLEGEIDNYVVVKSRGRITRLGFGAIRYAESANHSVGFHLRDGAGVDCFGSLNEFQDALLSDRRFIQCHKSFIVNMDYVTDISGRKLILTGNTPVPISRNFYVQVKSAYFDYFFEKGKRC